MLLGPSQKRKRVSNCFCLFSNKLNRIGGGSSSIWGFVKAIGTKVRKDQKCLSLIRSLLNLQIW
jgi:hypothetical protein